jgi:hypothetical protein
MANSFNGLLDITRINLHGNRPNASKMFPFWEKFVQCEDHSAASRNRMN